MKKNAVLISVVMMAVLITISSCKTDDPVPAEKKKYAWVTGAQDSTGYGMILFTPDAGETWERQGEDSDALKGINFSDIWAVDENSVWATGTDNTILRTTDGGQTWTRVQPPANITDTDLTPICIVNKTNIWIGGGYGSNGIVYKSINNGSTWTMLDTAFFHNNSIQGLWAISPEKVYVVGAHHTEGAAVRGFIGYTIDGGATWDSISPANNFNKWEWIGVVASGNTIVISGQQAHYIVSTDGGNTWKNDSVPNAFGGGGGADINDLIMLDSQTWWGAFDEGQIFITTDGGTNWTKQQTTPQAVGNFLVGIDNWDNQLALAVSTELGYPPRCPIIKTDDGGASWENKLICNSNLWKVTFIHD